MEGDPRYAPGQGEVAYQKVQKWSKIEFIIVKSIILNHMIPQIVRLWTIVKIPTRKTKKNTITLIKCNFTRISFPKVSTHEYLNYK